MSRPVVVRFAPSPTGPLHIGGVRTALYNYLFARKQNGTFILRIEDTDQTRYVEGAETYIREACAWLGIEFDEGPEHGGNRGPYRQSERVKAGLYRPYAEQLVAEGKAYYAFDTSDDLTAMRERLKAEGSSVQQYNAVTRLSMTNSFTLSKEEVEARISQGDPYVIRFDMPADEEITFNDIVRESVTFNSGQLDDKILLKSDGFPTYHLANVVDDHLMNISHVIRGEEWLSSTPLHVMLYRAFGWEESMPTFVHLPLILNPNGKGKMSKRAGDKMGFSVFPTTWNDPQSGNASIGYREQGYLPGALVNFMSLLGWNPGDEEELMQTERLIERFSLDRINQSPTNFDLDKLKWFNEQYIREFTSDKDLAELAAPHLSEAGFEGVEQEYLVAANNLMKERVSFIPEFVTKAGFLFSAPGSYDEKMSRKQWKEQTPSLMEALIESFSQTENWESEALSAAFEALVVEKEVGKGRVMAPLRLALTGVPSGPGVFDIAELIGKEETIRRIQQAIARLS